MKGTTLKICLIVCCLFRADLRALDYSDFLVEKPGIAVSVAYEVLPTIYEGQNFDSLNLDVHPPIFAISISPLDIEAHLNNPGNFLADASFNRRAYAQYQAQMMANHAWTLQLIGIAELRFIERAKSEGVLTPAYEADVRQRFQWIREGRGRLIVLVQIYEKTIGKVLPRMTSVHIRDQMAAGDYHSQDMMRIVGTMSITSDDGDGLDFERIHKRFVKGRSTGVQYTTEGVALYGHHQESTNYVVHPQWIRDFASVPAYYGGRGSLGLLSSPEPLLLPKSVLNYWAGREAMGEGGQLHVDEVVTVHGASLSLLLHATYAGSHHLYTNMYRHKADQRKLVIPESIKMLGEKLYESQSAMDVMFPRLTLSGLDPNVRISDLFSYTLSPAVAQFFEFMGAKLVDSYHMDGYVNKVRVYQINAREFETKLRLNVANVNAASQVAMLRPVLRRVAPIPLMLEKGHLLTNMVNHCAWKIKMLAQERQ